MFCFPENPMSVFYTLNLDHNIIVYEIEDYH